MKQTQQKPTDDLRMSSKEFDKVMSKALQVHPEKSLKLERAHKGTFSRKKRRTTK